MLDQLCHCDCEVCGDEGNLERCCVFSSQTNSYGIRTHDDHLGRFQAIRRPSCEHCFLRFLLAQHNHTRKMHLQTYLPAVMLALSASAVAGPVAPTPTTFVTAARNLEPRQVVTVSQDNPPKHSPIWGPVVSKNDVYVAITLHP